MTLPSIALQTRAASTTWQTGTANWSGTNVWNNGEPTLDEDAYINNGGTAQVTAGNSEYANDLFLGKDSGQSGSVLMTGGALSSEFDQYLGYSGTGAFTQQAGVNQTSYGHTHYDLCLGYLSGGSGTYTMTGGALYTADEYIGRLGIGAFIQSGGTNHLSATDSTMADHMYLGYGGAGGAGAGSYRLSGTALLSVDDDDAKIYVGHEGSYNGTGRFEWFREGGVVWSEGRDTGGMLIGINGTLAIGYNCSSLPNVVSGLENGTLEITNSATITKTNDGIISQSRYLRIGSGAGAGYGVQTGGTVQVGQTAYVGDGGMGVATQNGGTFSVASHMYLGINAVGASGTYRLNAGTLAVGGSIYGGSGTGTLVLDGGTLNLGGTYLNVTNLVLGDQAGRSGAYTLAAGRTANVGALTVGNSGTGAFSQTGGLNNVGSLTIGANSTYTMSGGTLAVSGAAIVGQGGSATWNIGSQNPTVGSLTVRNGNISGAGSITAGSTYVAENGTVSAKLAGSVGLVKSTSAGTVTLSGANTYSGATTLRAGTLVVGTNAPNGAAGALGNATSTVTLGDVGTQGGDDLSLLINGAYTVGRAVSVNNYGRNVSLGGNNASGTAVFGGNVTLYKNVNLAASGGSNGTVQFSGLITGGNTAALVGAGNVKVTPASTGATNVNYTVGTGGGRMLGGSNGSGTVQFTGNIVLNNAVSLSAASGGTVDFAAGTWTTNNNAVTVTGAGVVTVSNTLSTSGAVDVSSGRLLVGGTVGGGGSALLVSSGATLGGGGYIVKPVVVNGVMAPGNSTGLLTIDGNLTLAGISRFELEAYRGGGPGAGYYDGLSITGSGHTLSLGGALNVVNLGGGPAYESGQVYDLLDWGVNSVTGAFTAINLPTLTGGLQWKQFGGQPFDYATGQIVVEQGTQTTHYGLAAAIAVAPNVLRSGYVGATSSITCTADGSMDTLDFAGLNAVSSPGGGIGGLSVSGTNVQHGQTVSNTGLTFQGTEYNARVIVTPTVATATNHNIGGPAVLDWTNPASVNVGIAQAGPGLDRLLFGPPLVGQGKLKTIVRDYAGLASKTLPGSWLDEGETLGTEAVIREGMDSTGDHTVRMEWRQRYDGPVGGEPGSEIPETTFLCSDVLRLTGMDIEGGLPQMRHRSDVFVLEMEYTDRDDFPGKPHGLLYLDLGADQLVGGSGESADRWIGAPLGNFGGTLSPLAWTSWGEFRALHPGDLKDLLGCWGWEGDGLGNGRAWAVVDYNNAQFAVPEPSTVALLGVGALGLLGYGWRRLSAAGALPKRRPITWRKSSLG